MLLLFLLFLVTTQAFVTWQPPPPPLAPAPPPPLAPAPPPGGCSHVSMTIGDTGRVFEVWYPGAAQRIGVFQPAGNGTLRLDAPGCSCGERLVVRALFSDRPAETYDIAVGAARVVAAHPIYLDSEFIVPCAEAQFVVPFNTVDPAEMLWLEWNTSQDVSFRLTRRWRDRVLYNSSAYLVRTSYTSDPAVFHALVPEMRLHHPRTDGGGIHGPCRSPAQLADLTPAGLTTPCTFLEGMRHSVAQRRNATEWEFGGALELFALSEAEFTAWFPALADGFALWRPSLHNSTQPALRAGPPALREPFATAALAADGLVFAVPMLREAFWVIARAVDRTTNATWHLPLATFRPSMGTDARACAIAGVRGPFVFPPPANASYPDDAPGDYARASLDDNCTLRTEAPLRFEAVLVFAEQAGAHRKALVRRVSFAPQGATRLEVSFAVQSVYSSYEVTVLSVSETTTTATAVVRLLDKKGALEQVPDQLAVTTTTTGGAPGPAATVVLVQSDAALGFRDFTIAVAKEAFALATLTLRETETSGFVAAILTLRFSLADDLSVAVPDLNATTHLAIVAFTPNATIADRRRSAKRYMLEQFLPTPNQTVLLASTLEAFNVPSALRIPVGSDDETFCVFAGSSALAATIGLRAGVANASGSFDVTNPVQEPFAFNPYADADFDTELRRCHDQALCLNLTRLGRRFQMNATVDAVVAIEQDGECPAALGSRGAGARALSLEVLRARALTPDDAVRQFWIELAPGEAMQTSGSLFRFAPGDVDLWRACDMSVAAYHPVPPGARYQLLDEGYFVVPGLLPPRDACQNGSKFYVTRAAQASAASLTFPLLPFLVAYSHL